MFLDKRAAAWVTSYLLADGPVHDVAKRIDPHWALLTVKIAIVVAPYVFPDDPSVAKGLAEVAKELADAVHESQALEPVLFQAEVALGDDLVKAQQIRLEAEAKDEQAKAALNKADAELAAAVIEEQTIVVEREIEAQKAQSGPSVAEINEKYDLKEQDLDGKIDALAQNYFDKHPGLSDDQRNEANKTFGAIREEEKGKLLSERQAELEASREQQQKREELEERRKELEGTRADRS